jgi:hypothetical protein
MPPGTDDGPGLHRAGSGTRRDSDELRRSMAAPRRPATGEKMATNRRYPSSRGSRRLAEAGIRTPGSSLAVPSRLHAASGSTVWSPVTVAGQCRNPADVAIRSHRLPVYLRADERPPQHLDGAGVWWHRGVGKAVARPCQSRVTSCELRELETRNSQLKTGAITPSRRIPSLPPTRSTRRR